MEPRRVVLFAQALEHRSLTRAARAAHMTQPSLSRQIASLEREAGVRLINRTPDGISATAAGEKLLRRAHAIRAQLDLARQELDEVLALEAGRLRLAAFPTAAATLALEALLSLRTAHRGWRGNTIAEIITKTGIARTSLYRHLPPRPAPAVTADGSPAVARDGEA